MLNTQVARIALLLGAALALSTGILPVSATPILSITPSSPVVQPGQSFSLHVDIANVTDLFALQFDLAFNPAVLSVASITEGSFLPSGGSTFFIPGTIDNTGGTIAATGDSLLGAIAGVSGSGTLATISLQALTLGTSSITLSHVLLLDSSLGEITVSLGAGSVTVQPATGVPEPSATLLLAIGLAGVFALGWWCQQRAA